VKFSEGKSLVNIRRHMDGSDIGGLNTHDVKNRIYRNSNSAQTLHDTPQLYLDNPQTPDVSNFQLPHINSIASK
jgi:hypothetical protein